jgi:tetratricopeptide (TPR) repeat protein
MLLIDRKVFLDLDSVGELSEINVGLLPELYKNYFRYLLSKYYYFKEEYGKSGYLAHSIPPESKFYRRAKYLEGLVLVRENNYKKAAELLISAQGNILSPKRRRVYEPVKDLMNLALARIYYGMHEYKQSIKYYRKLTKWSNEWLTGIFESSWAYFVPPVNNHNQALGNLHTLHSPYFKDFYFPESLVLEAMIFLRLCQYDFVRAALRSFRQYYYNRVIRKIEKFNRKYKRNSYKYFRIVQDFRGAPKKKYQIPTTVLDHITRDHRLEMYFKKYDHINQQLDYIKALPGKWQRSSLAQEVSRATQRMRKKVADFLGILVRDRMIILANQGINLSSQVDFISVEMIEGVKGQFEEELVVGPDGKKRLKKSDKEALEIEAPTGFSNWLFDQEYWMDDLGNYVYNTTEECQE